MGDRCATIPPRCPKGRNCPTVIARPATDLGSDQWLYLSLKNFPAGSDAEIYYCSDKRRITDAAPPVCVLSTSAVLPYPQIQTPIFPNGTAVSSFHVQSDIPGSGNPALQGQVPGDPRATISFFCDDAKNPCSIDVVDPGLVSPPSNVPSPSDTAVVPVSFLPPSNGCPEAARNNWILYTSSDWGIYDLLPHESPSACTGRHPVIALDTATDSENAVRQLISGADQVAFVEDPDATDLKSLLAHSGHHYRFIPIVASAVVMAYQAAMQYQSFEMFPFDRYRLTPNMVAGIVTYNYASPFQTDVVKCAVAGGGSAPCSALQSLNTSPGYTPPQAYGSFIPSAPSPVTEALTNWICSAPNLPFRLDGKKVTDPHTARRTLTSSNFDRQWPIKTCGAIDQFPPIQSPASADFALLSTPSQQAKYLRAYAPPPTFQPDPVAGFAPLDWSEARYYGFDVASLQNADGQFVAPTAQSVDAALYYARRNVDGTLSFRPRARIPGAYPMPSVIYAVVPTDHVSALEASNIDGMLSRLLAFTTGATAASDLPDGYVRLPAKLATTARADLAGAIKLETPPVTPPPTPPPTTTPPTTTPAPPPTTTPPPPTTTPPPPTTTPPTSKPDPAHTGTNGHGHGHVHSRPRPARRTGPSAIPLESVALAGTPAVLLLPGVFWAGALALLAALVLLLVARRRKLRPGREI